MTVREMVKASGYKMRFITDTIHMKPANFSNKLKGKTEFKVSEIVALSKVLDVSVNEIVKALIGEHPIYEKRI